jgi:hypothetical protein
MIPEVLKSGKPAVMNFVVYESEKVFPMIPAGAGLDEMVIGDQEEGAGEYTHSEYAPEKLGA